MALSSGDELRQTVKRRREQAIRLAMRIGIAALALSVVAVAAETEVAVNLPEVPGPWKNVYADSPYFRMFADRLAAVAESTGDRPALLVEAEFTYGTRDPIGPASYGVGEISPTFYVDDDAANVLGLDATTGRPGLCLKTMDGWTSVYSAAPGLAAPVLRGLARRAGVHLYLDEDAVVYANRSLLSVTVVEAGRRTIRLPNWANVEDALTGEVVATDADRFGVDFAERESRLFLMRKE
jgi:hypothetical protein